MQFLVVDDFRFSIVGARIVINSVDKLVMLFVCERFNELKQLKTSWFLLLLHVLIVELNKTNDFVSERLKF